MSPEQSNTRHTSVSATSTTNGPSGSVFSAVHGESSVTSAPDLIEPPPLGAFKKKRRQSHRKPILEKTLREPSKTKQQRYWNEFDDGSEGSENEAYTIFVNPDASYSFPGAATASRLFRSLGAAINKAEEKVASWLQSSPKSKNRENEPLINGDHSPSLEDSDISDAEYSPQQVKRVSRRRYSTFPALSQTPAIRARENLLFRSCLASFGASFVLLIVAAILESTGRRKAEATVDAGVIIGVAASLVFAIIAVGSMVGRKDDVGWVHRSIILLIFACVVVGCGALLASLG